LAPSNPKLLNEAGLEIGFTSFGLKNADAFWSALRKTIARGLAPQEAMAALTTTPAKWMGQEQLIGTL
jgi:imidazolonepropionase-like amidohydrolase